MKRKIEPGQDSGPSGERTQKNVLLHADKVKNLPSRGEEAEIRKKRRRKEYSAAYHRSNRRRLEL